MDRKEDDVKSKLGEKDSQEERIETALAASESKLHTEQDKTSTVEEHAELLGQGDCKTQEQDKTSTVEEHAELGQGDCKTQGSAKLFGKDDNKEQDSAELLGKGDTAQDFAELSSKKDSKAQDSAEVQDLELNALLDNALSDFLADSSTKSIKSDAPTEDSKDTDSTELNDIDFEPLIEQLQKVSISGDLNYDLTPLMAEFSKITEAVESRGEDDGGLRNVMESVMESVQNLSSENSGIMGEQDAADLAHMLGATSLSSDDVAKSIENEMAPYLLEIMKMFFSKDVFYQPVKDLVERYPEWLSTNEASLSLEAYNQRVKQLDVLTRLCTEYENEKSTDSEDDKSQRFKTILDLINELKKCGNPPTELLDQDYFGFKIDEASAMPDLDQCCLM